jgi:hypothetical protein
VGVFKYQVRVPFRSGGSFPAGTVIDHWIFSYVSGPTVLTAVTVPATQFYLGYNDQNLTNGTYVISAQAYNPSNLPVGAPINVTFTIPFEG